MSKMYLKEALDMLDKGGKLIIYWGTGVKVIQFNGEHELDGRTYQGLLNRHIRPEIIGYNESLEYDE